MEDIIVDYNLDGSITVDYFGSDENKKTIVKNIHNTLYELFREEVEETRFTRNVTGAFLTVYVKGDKKIVTNISNFIEKYIKMDEYVNKIKNENEGERLNDEKKPNQHD